MTRGAESKAGSCQERFTATLEEERGRIVRHCTSLTGNRDIAEDLAQETLIEAWRSQDNLRDPEQIRSWLHGIARNVYLRWRRRVGRESSRMTPFTLEDISFTGQEAEPAGHDEDLDVELDRAQLADLLDRALDQLPADTRAMLTEQFINERPQQEIAERYGVSRGAVAMRVRRGKLMLRRVLVEQFPREAVSHGLIPEQRAMLETSLWCRTCGARPLSGHIDDQGTFALRCPECYPAHGISEMRIPAGWALYREVSSTGFRSIYERTALFSRSYLSDGLRKGTATCLSCGAPAFVRSGLPEHLAGRARDRHGITVECPICDTDASCSLSGLILSSPEGRAFRSAHPRTRTMPEHYVERAGHRVIVSRFQPIHGTRTFVALTDERTLHTHEFFWAAS